MRILYLLLFFFWTFGFSQKVVIIGIAQDAGYPQADCQDSCCKNVYEGKFEKQMVSSLAVSDGTQFFIIDATPDFTDQLKLAQDQFPNQKLAGIFLTHAHIGHYTGIMYLGKESMNASHVKVYTMSRMKKFLELNGPWSQLVSSANIDIIEMKADAAIKLSSNLSITPVIVPHRDEYSETVGYYIKGKSKQLLYIPDIDKWDKWQRNIVDEIKRVDYALLDGTFYDDKEMPGRNMSEIPHPFIKESINLFNELDTLSKAKIWLIHFNHTNRCLDPQSNASSEVRKAGFNLSRLNKVFDLTNSPGSP